MIALNLLVEGVVAILLAVTIGYAFVLNRRLIKLRSEQEDLGRFISALNQATARAQEGIYELRATSQTTEDALKREIGAARALADELALIIESGGNLAAKIEHGLLPRRNASEAVSQPVTKIWDREETSHDDLRKALRVAR